MFSLIITIIGIALVAALILATVWYGGNRFDKRMKRLEAKIDQLGKGPAVNIAPAVRLDAVDSFLARAEKVLAGDLERYHVKGPLVTGGKGPQFESPHK